MTDEQAWALSLVPEILWANLYHDAIIESEWLKDKTISPSGSLGMAVGYNFVYPLYRILDEMHPKNILETGLGQSTRLTAQYAGYYKATHSVVEHDPNWAKFFLESFKGMSDYSKLYVTPLYMADHEGIPYYAYQNFEKILNHIAYLTNVEGGYPKFDFIVIDGPFGGGKRARRDIIAFIPQCLNDDFVIMIDDCGRPGEIHLCNQIQSILQSNGIKFASTQYSASGINKVGIITSESKRFFASL